MDGLGAFKGGCRHSVNLGGELPADAHRRDELRPADTDRAGGAGFRGPAGWPGSAGSWASTSGTGGISMSWRMNWR